MGSDRSRETSCTKLRISNMATFDSFRCALPAIPAKALDKEGTARKEPKTSKTLVSEMDSLILRADVQYL